MQKHIQFLISPDYFSCLDFFLYWRVCYKVIISIHYFYINYTVSINNLNRELYQNFITRNEHIN